MREALKNAELRHGDEGVVALWLRHNFEGRRFSTYKQTSADKLITQAAKKAAENMGESDVFEKIPKLYNEGGEEYIIRAYAKSAKAGDVPETLLRAAELSATSMGRGHASDGLDMGDIQAAFENLSDTLVGYGYAYAVDNDHIGSIADTAFTEVAKRAGAWE
jgi:hypothetical protein